MKVGKHFLEEFIKYIKENASSCVTIDSTDLSGPHRYDGQLMVYLKVFRLQQDKKELTAEEVDEQLENLGYWDLIHHIAFLYKNEKTSSGLIADLVKSGRLLRVLKRLESIIPNS